MSDRGGPAGAVVAELLTRAVGEMVGDRLEAAGSALRAALAVSSDHPDSLYLAGVLAGLDGRTALSDALIARAAADPAIGLFDRLLGRACREQAGFARLAGLYGIDLCLRGACRPLDSPRVLAGVTLCCIDTAYQDLTLVAIKNSLAQCRFDRVLFLTDDTLQPPGMEIAPVGCPIPSAEAYSRFVLKDLPERLDTPFTLISQWDGFLRDASLWSDEFLQFDYIGARWTCFADDHLVGNGGFSLRSRRLLEAGTDPAITQFHPEDFHLGRTYRPYLEQARGIRFADTATADRFSIEQLANPDERARPVASFGFHNLFRMYEVVDPRYLDLFLDLLPVGALLSNSMALLAVSHIRMGEWAPACRIARRMLARNPHHECREMLEQILSRAPRPQDALP